VTVVEIVTDPKLIKELERYREVHGQLINRFNQLIEQIERQRIISYEDLQQVDQHSAQALVKLASNTQPFQLGGRAFVFFGLTSTGKSTMINKLIGFDLAETTQEIQLYDGRGYRLFDIPGRNDDISYFSMEFGKD
jgi:ribosome biogenesis GTPase A